MNSHLLKSKINGVSIFIGLLLIIIACGKSKDNSLNQVEDLTDTTEIPEVIDFNFHVRPILSDRCFKCHGPDKAKIEAGLSFASFEAATLPLGELKDHHAIVPGDPNLSTTIQRIFSENPAEIMPPPESNLKLSDHEKKILERWIEQGAKWKQHWSFLPIKSAAIPKTNDAARIYNPIDYFIQDRLTENPLTPSDPASKERLIRRISFDLTGLPPTIEEIEAYLADDSNNATSNIIDQYLNSDGYAENMTTQWMDLSRYADTHGYQDDLERVMWPWRDWVLHSFKKNMPYDKFVTWQLAGDLLPNANKEQIIATAFNRNHSITQEGGVIPEEYRIEYVSDRTNTFGKAFLGLTVECAKCHDHKYDPISQKDFYSLSAFFNNIPEKGLIEQYGAIPEPYVTISKKEMEETLFFINNLDDMDDLPLMVMKEMPKPRQAYILDRGAYDHPSTPVSPDVPREILDMKKYKQNRLGLSKWLFDKENPLTARVAVNRLWAMCFGKGLVSTIDDFGSQGALPSHPKLLDHLAKNYMEEGWDQRKILKYILSSYTYQQSSKATPDMLEIDPENNYYARAPRLRLSAEKIRDHALATSGLLVKTIGGPSVKPYQPPGLWKEKVGGGGGTTAEYKQDEGDKQYRRSLYTFWKRTVPPPSMITFDAVSRDLCMVTRESTSTPLQALVMMNNPEILEASRNLAYLAIEKSESENERLKLMFRNVTSREASEKELEILSFYLASEKKKFAANETSAKEFLLVGNSPQKDLLPISDMAAYAFVANTIYNLDESITRS